MSENFEIPEEINTHFHLFKKQMWEMTFEYKCDICDCRIDNSGFCACGSGSE